MNKRCAKSRALFFLSLNINVGRDAKHPGVCACVRACVRACAHVCAVYLSKQMVSKQDHLALTFRSGVCLLFMPLSSLPHLTFTHYHHRAYTLVRARTTATFCLLCPGLPLAPTTLSASACRRPHLKSVGRKRLLPRLRMQRQRQLQQQQ